ncbi:hypothetical protein JCM8547_000084 [Rhodosporidiobolus lusitaniae]
MERANAVPSKVMAIAVGLFASFGYNTSDISGVKSMPYFIEHYGDLNDTGEREITVSTDSLITSILSVDTFFGALVGRVLAEFGVGGVSAGAPVYQSEVSPKAWRGAIISCYQLFVTLGLLIAAIIVNATKDMYFGAAWQIPIGVQLVWFAILLVGLFVLPEPPRWLLVKGREEKARRSLGRPFCLPVESEYVAVEYARIAAKIHSERARGTVSYPELLCKSAESRLPLRVWTGVALQMLQRLSGVDFVFYTTFLRNSGNENPFLITIATTVVNVGMIFLGIWAADKLGRRKTMIFGAVGMAASQLIIAIIGTAIGSGDPAGQKVRVAFVCIFVAFFSSIWGQYAWVITAEIMPNAARSCAGSIMTQTQWLRRSEGRRAVRFDLHCQLSGNDMKDRIPSKASFSPSPICLSSSESTPKQRLPFSRSKAPYVTS